MGDVHRAIVTGLDGATYVDKVADDGWTGFLCVETANALDDTLTVEPGETRTITTRLSVG